MGNESPPSRGKGVKGIWVLLALFGGALVVVPLATWATARWVESGLVETPKLNWHSRERWPNTPVRWTTMRRQGVQVSASQTWRELHFEIDGQTAAVLRECVELARLADEDPDAFVKPMVGGLLRQLARQAPESFYPAYILGTWHRLRGEAEPANAAYHAAFERAHGAVKQRYVTLDDQPAGGLRVGTFELVHGRSDGHDLDESLVLVYPALETDGRGYVYLPVYQTVYRVERAPRPNDGVVEYRFEQWFDFPDRIGTLRPAVVRARDE